MPSDQPRRGASPGGRRPLRSASPRRRGRSRSSSRSRHRHGHRRRSASPEGEQDAREPDAEQQRLRNREEVAHRSRMWTVVDSDSETRERGDQKSAQHAPRRHSRDRKRRKRSASSSPSSSSSRSRSRSSSESSSDSEASNSSSDSSNGGRSRRHRRKHKRSRSKSKKRRRSDDKKAKKAKKAKKKKHEKKTHKKDRKQAASHAVNQNEYGKYGILRESDFHSKSVSFQAWLRGVKKISDFNGPKWEAMELFKEYMEDYNTCTLPHEKYYDVEKYELQQYQNEQRRAHKKLAGKAAQLGALADEERVRRERRAQREQKEQAEFRLVLQTMDKDKIEDMRHQEHMRAQMQMHYKSGNVAEARRLEQILNKVDEDKLRR